MTLFFPKMSSKKLRTQRSKIRHPSRAGIGSKLNTHKFMEIRAESKRRNMTPLARDSVTTLTIHIGPAI